MDKLIVKTELGQMLLLTLLLTGPSLLNAQERLTTLCYEVALSVNQGEEVTWSDLDSCNQVITLGENDELVMEEYLASLINRSIILMELTEYQRAGADLDAALILDSESFSLHINLGLLSFLQKDYAEAITNFSRVIDLALLSEQGSSTILDAEHQNLIALALYNRALAYGYEGDTALALSDLRALQSEYPFQFLSWVSTEDSDVFPVLLELLAPVTFESN